MFINLYENSNIDCNKKVENKIIKEYNRIIYYLIKHVRTKSSAKHVDRLL